MLHALGRAAKSCGSFVTSCKGKSFLKYASQNIHAATKNCAIKKTNTRHFLMHPACAAAASGISCLACEFSGSGSCTNNKRQSFGEADISRMHGAPADIRPMHCKTKSAMNLPIAIKKSADMNRYREILEEIELLSVNLADSSCFRDMSAQCGTSLFTNDCEDQQPRRADGRIIEPWEENQSQEISLCASAACSQNDFFRKFRNAQQSAESRTTDSASAQKQSISLILIASLGSLSSIQAAKTAKKIFSNSGVRVLALPVGAENHADPAAIFDLTPDDAAAVIEGKRELPSSKPSENAKRFFSRALALTEGVVAPLAAIMKETNASGKIQRAEFCSGNSEEIIAAAERFAADAIYAQG